MYEKCSTAFAAFPCCCWNTEINDSELNCVPKRKSCTQAVLFLNKSSKKGSQNTWPCVWWDCGNFPELQNTASLLFEINASPSIWWGHNSLLPAILCSLHVSEYMRMPSTASIYFMMFIFSTFYSSKRKKSGRKELWLFMCSVFFHMCRVELCI